MPDAVIDELRALREEHAARHGYDIKSIFREIRAREEASGREYVRYPPRRIDAVKEARAASPTCAGTSRATNTATTS